MRVRLILVKVNPVIDGMTQYAEANAHVITVPRKKVCVSFSSFENVLHSLDCLFVKHDFLLVLP